MREKVNYKEIEEYKMLEVMGIDAAKWADAFQQIIVDPKKEIDEGLMIGWFANAIMSGYDMKAKKLKRVSYHTSANQQSA